MHVGKWLFLVVHNHCIFLSDTNADTKTLPAQSFNWQAPRLPAFLKKRWVHHLLFWIVYYGVFTLVVVYGIYRVNDVWFYIGLVPIYLLDIALVYFNFYVLMPRLFERRKYLYYGLALALAMMVAGCLSVLLRQVMAKYASSLFVPTSIFNFSNVTGTVIERFYAVVFTTLLRVVKHWVQNQQREKERGKQMLEAELNFLKSQIQPHFFFNTLNNLYSLTLKKSDQAPEVVLKLSDLMSYMLYETNAPKVSLNKEIAYLENYIDLERLRFGNNLTVAFNIEGQTDGVYLPPLVLILFIENCFKHGARDTMNKMEVDICIKVEDNVLLFKVKNPVAEINTGKSVNGIGLKNARRRLQLLYGNSYTLEETKKEKEYIVVLKIPV